MAEFRRFKGVQDYLGKFVVPLYKKKSQGFEFMGTGFFVSLPNRTALVTAAHVLELFSEHEPLFTFGITEELISIGGLPHTTSSEFPDLAFILLDTVSQDRIASSIYTCTLDQLVANRTPREHKHYYIAGFPETKNRPKVGTGELTRSNYGVLSRSIPESEYQSHGLDPATHVAMTLDPKKGHDLEGANLNFPKPNGMSGAPIWEITYTSSDRYDLENIPLVAVGTNYRANKKLLFGSDVHHLLERLTK